LIGILLISTWLSFAGALQAPQAGAEPAVQKPGGEPVENLTLVKRIYVAPLTGGVQADALRDLIIASLNSTKLFVLTENPDRADAILKGAADDQTFTDTFDSQEGASVRDGAAKGGYTESGAVRFSLGAADNESHHIKERKHEAYATVRLCNRDGDVLWSTTQESLGAKFRGASADVADKIARQLALDFDRARRPAPSSTSNPGNHKQ
jgi:hypothetical protein